MKARLKRANELETQGDFKGAASLCEAALDGSELPDDYFTLARNYFNLAYRGDETFAWKAAFAAIEGIDRRATREGRADAQYAVGIIRWVLDHFADWQRQDVPSSYLVGAQIDAEKAQAADTFMRARREEFGRRLQSEDPMSVVNSLYRLSPFIVRQGRSIAGIEREARFALTNQFSQLPGGNAAEFIGDLQLPVPGGFNFQSYDRYLLTASRMGLERAQARARGVPAIVIASMPKSGSEFLCYTLAETLAAPIARVSIGDPFLGVVVEAWLREVAKGGCVLHDHFSARPENVAAFQACGMEGIHVLVRDPRAVAFSLRNMELELGKTGEAAPRSAGDVSEAQPATKAPPATKATPKVKDIPFQNFAPTVKLISQWLETWLDANDRGLKVEFIRFGDLIERPLEVMGAVLARHGAAAFEERLAETLAKKGKGSNFRKGDDNAWRSSVPAWAVADAWAVIAPGVRELLRLEP